MMIYKGKWLSEMTLTREYCEESTYTFSIYLTRAVKILLKSHLSLETQELVVSYQSIFLSLTPWSANFSEELYELTII